MNLLFLTYNNYYNRTIKRESTTDAYDRIASHVQEFYDIQFNPNDGINTEQIVSWVNNNWTPDYLVVYDDTLAPNIAIQSRWFVMEWVRTRGGQYKATLHRDVIADNYDDVVSAPCFIKRAIAQENNPLILNSEGMTYNQIKKEEILLKDISETPWIVGYINKKSLNTFTTKFTITSNTGSHTFSNIGEVESVILHSNDSAGNSYDIELQVKGPFDTYGYTFDSSTHVLTWNIAQTLMTTSYLLIEAGGEKNVSIKTFEEPSNYINAEDLPWDFNPNATALGTLSGTVSIDMFGWNNTGISTGRQVAFGVILSKDSQNTWRPTSSSDVWATAGSLQNINNSGLYPLYSDQYDITSGINLTTFKSNVFNVFRYPTNETKITEADISKILSAGGLSYCSVDPSSYNGAVVKYNGYYYQLSIGTASQDFHTFEFDKNTDQINGLYSKIHANYKAIANRVWLSNQAWYEHEGTNSSLNAFRGTFYSNGYSITITPYSLVENDISIRIPARGVRNACLNAPYDIFAIPFNSVQLKTAEVYTDNDITEQLVQNLALELGSNLYDVQLLPYCPILNVPYEPGKIQEVGTEGINYTYIKDSNNNIKGIIYFCSTSKATFDLDIDLHINNYTNKAFINKKIDSETVLYRLVSPNYNGQFEFKVANNNEAISKINIDLEYKPYVPYIHVSPIWSENGLYGGDYNDARGLICGGDFSLPIVNDAWVQYQIQNKNYQNIFDRQIQNMNTQFNISQWAKDTQADINMITAPIAGAAAGAMKGGPWGAVIGAGAGAVAGAAGRVGRGIDSYVEQQMFTENVSYAKDSFRYNLQNIQALPYSISRVSSFNNNNKIFPFIEKYEATEEEVEALINKITYTSMEIGVVDTISNYLVEGNKYFVSGNILRLDSLEDDTHTATAIFAEINKGVYI